MDMRPSDVKLRGYPECPIRGIDDGEGGTAGRQRLIVDGSLSAANPQSYSPALEFTNVGYLIGL